MSSGPDDNEQRLQSDSGDPRPESIGTGIEPEAEDTEKLVLAAPDSATSLRDVSLWAGIFFLLSFIVYSPALWGDFLWDDDKHVSENMALRSTEGFSKLWVPKTTPQYYPVTHTVFWLQYQIAELADGTINTFVFHVTNVLIHAIGATLLWFILRRLQVPGAWLAAAVFAVHPVNVESVAWISELKNVLSGAFFFGSVFVYLRFADLGVAVLPGSDDAKKRGNANKPGADEGDNHQPRWDLYGLSLFLFACALLSKSVTCAMPAVMVILIWWKRGRFTARDLLLIAPFFALGLAMAGITFWMEQSHVIGTHAASGEWTFSVGYRLLIAGHAVWFYFSKLLLPLNLTFIYPKWNIDTGSALQWLYPTAVLVAIGVLWALRKKIGRAPLAATLIYVGMLVPALGFINVYPMRYSYAADHFQYHASAAMIALIVGGLALLARRFFPDVGATNVDPTSATTRAGKDSHEAPRLAAAPTPRSALSQSEDPSPSPAPYILGTVLVVALMLVAWNHAKAFDSAISLWEDTVEKNPTAWMAYNNLSGEYFALAAAYELRGDAEATKESLQSAIGAAQKAIEIKNDHDKAYINRGLAQEMLGNIEAALADYTAAFRFNPKNAEAAFYMANALDQLGRHAEAVDTYDAALALDNDLAERFRPRVLRAKGNTLMSLERDADAEAAFLRAIEINGDYFDARHDYGVLLAQQGKQNEALKEFLYILRRDPRHINAKVSLAGLQMRVGNLTGAQRELIEAGLIDPYNERLMAAAKQWNELKDLTDATTRSTTTQASTTQATTQSATTQYAPVPAATTSRPVDAVP